MDFYNVICIVSSSVRNKDQTSWLPWRVFYKWLSLNYSVSSLFLWGETICSAAKNPLILEMFLNVKAHFCEEGDDEYRICTSHLSVTLVRF